MELRYKDKVLGGSSGTGGQVDSGKVYSTEETRIGTYLDKPLYSRVVTGTIEVTSTNGGVFYSADWLKDIDTRMVSSGILYENHYYQPIPTFVRINNYDKALMFLFVDAVRGNITINFPLFNNGNPIDYTASFSIQVTLEYTKATDVTESI